VGRRVWWGGEGGGGGGEHIERERARENGFKGPCSY